jgi:hypothetical protein
LEFLYNANYNISFKKKKKKKTFKTRSLYCDEKQKLAKAKEKEYDIFVSDSVFIRIMYKVSRIAQSM